MIVPFARYVRLRSSLSGLLLFVVAGKHVCQMPEFIAVRRLCWLISCFSCLVIRHRRVFPLAAFTIAWHFFLSFVWYAFSVGMWIGVGMRNGKLVYRDTSRGLDTQAFTPKAYQTIFTVFVNQLSFCILHLAF